MEKFIQDNIQFLLETRNKHKTTKIDDYIDEYLVKNKIILNQNFTQNFTNLQNQNILNYLINNKMFTNNQVGYNCYLPINLNNGMNFHPMNQMNQNNLNTFNNINTVNNINNDINNINNINIIPIKQVQENNINDNNTINTNSNNSNINDNINNSNNNSSKNNQSIINLIKALTKTNPKKDLKK